MLREPRLLAFLLEKWRAFEEKIPAGTDMRQVQVDLKLSLSDLEHLIRLICTEEGKRA